MWPPGQANNLAPLQTDLLSIFVPTLYFRFIPVMFKGPLQFGAPGRRPAGLPINPALQLRLSCATTYMRVGYNNGNAVLEIDDIYLLTKCVL
jgi:hypothetical protein